ncbi:hypothetical protein ARMGADRAFT_1025554 [Armillaria gallica]|uniref:Uncharacterized protein n=1 Tax=Armillaria gallica TaxID=47427 RepID=A0A2H3EJC1_ARMGA|nr:hypothetical protein ARMGADRAFT_1025554 [Armillaria gallica]
MFFFLILFLVVLFIVMLLFLIVDPYVLAIVILQWLRRLSMVMMFAAMHKILSGWLKKADLWCPYYVYEEILGVFSSQDLLQLTEDIVQSALPSLSDPFILECLKHFVTYDLVFIWD